VKSPEQLQWKVITTSTNPGGKAVKSFSILVTLEPPKLNVEYLSGAVVGSQYSRSVTWSGAVTTIELTGGALPAGLALNSSTGEIAGVPTATGTYNFTLTGRSSGGLSSGDYSIKVTTAANIAGNSSFETTTNRSLSDNYALNPETRVTGAAVGTPDSALYTLTREADTGTAPPGLGTLNSALALRASTGNTTSTLFAGSNFDGRGTLASSRVMGMWVQTRGPGTFTAKVGDGAAQPLINGQWTFVSSNVASTGAAAGRLVIQKTNGAVDTANEYALVTGIMSTSGSGYRTAYAPIQAKDYFSGSTPVRDGFVSSWTGTPNASQSVMTADTPSLVTPGASVWSASTEWASTGYKSVRVEAAYPTAGSSYVDLKNLPGTPTLAEMRGKTYTMVAKVRTADPRSAAPSLAYVETIGSTSSHKFDTAPNAPGVYQLRNTFTVSNNADQIYLRLYNGAEKGQPDVWFDDYALVEGVYTGDYITPIDQTLPSPTFPAGPVSYQLPNISFPATGWAIKSGVLPNGLSLSTSGLITGTATEQGSFPLILRETTQYGDTDTPIRITTNILPPTITTTTLPDVTVGKAYSQSLVSPGPGTVTWSLKSGSLPPGLSLSPNGLISGTATAPYAANTAAVTFTATNGGGSKDVTIQLNTLYAPVVSNQTIARAVGANFSYQLPATANPSAITWQLLSGTYPSGVTSNTSGVVSGTPTATGTTTMTFRATNSVGTADMTLTINTMDAPTITTTTVPNGIWGNAYTTTLAGAGSPTYTLASGTMPPGLAISPAGVISGTPTAAGVYNFTVSAANAVGVASRSLTITVPTPAMSIAASQQMYQNLAIATAIPLGVSNLGSTGLTYSVTAGALPAGVTLSGATLTGTPTGSGNYSATITARNAGGGFVSKVVAFNVALQQDVAWQATTAPLATPTPQFGVPYNMFVTGVTGTATLRSGTMPAGLTLDANTGRIYGIRTTKEAVSISYARGGLRFNRIDFPALP
jgi:hypothetical protein